MDLTELKLFRMTAKRMDWTSKRQQVLSQNIANADTPGYAAEDLKQLSFRDLMKKRTVMQTLEKTNSLHIEASHKQPLYRPDPEKSPYEVAPAGNGVVLEEQLTKVSEAQANHRLASNLYSKHLALLKMAIGNPNR